MHDAVYSVVAEKGEQTVGLGFKPRDYGGPYRIDVIRSHSLATRLGTTVQVGDRILTINGYRVQDLTQEEIRHMQRRRSILVDGLRAPRIHSQ